MPTVRYRSRRRATSVMQLDAWQEFVVSHATAVRLEQTFGPDWQRLAEAAWDVHGERLTSAWIASRPGSRPALWWALDHGKSRPVVSPAPPEVERKWREEHSLLGVCHADILHGHGAGGGLVPWLEPQRDYLHRRRLLTDAERLAAAG